MGHDGGLEERGEPSAVVFSRLRRWTKGCEDFTCFWKNLEQSTNLFHVTKQENNH